MTKDLIGINSADEIPVKDMVIKIIITGSSAVFVYTAKSPRLSPSAKARNNKMFLALFIEAI